MESLTAISLGRASAEGREGALDSARVFAAELGEPVEVTLIRSGDAYDADESFVYAPSGELVDYSYSHRVYRLGKRARAAAEKAATA
jgi:hypothetical protein